MKRAHLNLLSILLCGACGACGQAPSSGETPATAIADKHMLKPGQYDVEFVREVMVPGQPSEPSKEVDSQCFSAGDLAQPETIFVPHSDGCTQHEAKASGRVFSATMTCRMPEYSASDVVFEVHGSYDPEGADLAGEASIDGVTLRETRTFRRRSDC